MRRFKTSHQLALFSNGKENCSLDAASTNKIVNVASVPMRSPFRYPGGKTWLVPKIREWLGGLPEKPLNFVEPFAGGGIISLTVAFEGLAQQVTMIELDENVAAVWQAILGDDAEWLADRILQFDLTPESARKELDKPASSIRCKAFQTLLRNRIHHGGILAPGSGITKNGENGKGILSRWYPGTLAGRILAIQKVKANITFICGDGVKAITDNTGDKNSVFFIDPPYTASGKKAGRRLYKYNALDHEDLFYKAALLQGDFLMTYDNNEWIYKLACKYGFDVQPIAMKNTHHAKMTELLIGRNLDWARSDG